MGRKKLQEVTLVVKIHTVATDVEGYHDIVGVSMEEL